MSRVATGADFREALRRIRLKWEAHGQLWTDRQEETDPRTPALTVEQRLLESQGRALLVDPILSSLNWGPENMVPEHSNKHPDWGSPRRMDNFGFEAVFGVRANPLLVVEVKRPDEPPPDLGSLARQGVVNQLLDYFRAIYARLGGLPRRAVITNGLWWVVALVPDRLCGTAPSLQQDARIDALLGHWQDNQPHDLFLIEGLDALFERAEQVFRLLDFHAVSQAPHTIQASVVAALLDVTELTHRAWCIRVDYEPRIRPHASSGAPSHRPRMTVTPVVMVRRADGTWFRIVEHPHGIGDLPDVTDHRLNLPPNPTVREDHVLAIREHIDAVTAAGDELLDLLEAALPGVKALPALSLRDLRTLEGSQALPRLVEDQNATLFWLTLGDQRHFIDLPVAPATCPGHVASDAEREWGQAAAAVAKPSSERPRCFSPDRHTLHCAQHTVSELKATAPLTPHISPNRGGLRLRADTPFCRLFSLDARHCCRTCTFIVACQSEAPFRLPCHRP